MGGGKGRGKRPTRKEYLAAQIYRATHGDAHIARLRQRGATTQDIAKMEDHFHKLRAQGVLKPTARFRAEKAAGFRPGVRRRSE